MICISEYSFKKCFSSVQRTCKSIRIGQMIASPQYIDCEQKCSEDANCKFVFYTPERNEKNCIKYPSCSETRQTFNIGSTYSKDGICPGIKILK